MMDDKNSRGAGTKVSQIANIFQSRTHREDVIIIRNKPKPPSPTVEKTENDSPTVTVMRTESHVARFNNARALFEKLGEENRTVTTTTTTTTNNTSSKFHPLQTTKSASSIQDLRSRSSSVTSENKDRSPSPKRDKYDVIITNKINDNDSTRTSSTSSPNGHYNKEPNKLNGEKPILMKKPEKPERKFNSKELIEKQRNWPAHFSKTRSSRCNSDPGKNDVKLAVSNGRTSSDVVKNNTSATRSASFNNKLQTPPTSPNSQQPEVTKRNNIIRKDRPASVIPNITTNTSPIKETNYHKKDSSQIDVKDSKFVDAKVITSDYKLKNEQSNDTNCNYNNKKLRTPQTISSSSSSATSLPPTNDNNDNDEVCTKGKDVIIDDKESLYSCVKKNKDKRDDGLILGNTTGKLECKTESEKQEHEDDEKHSLGKYYSLLEYKFKCL